MKGVPTWEGIKQLSCGINLDGAITAPAKVKLMKREGTLRSWLRITIYEGRKRQVKNMCAAIGNPVIKLRRTSFALLTARGLKTGHYRRLTGAETVSYTHLRNYLAGLGLLLPGGAAGGSPVPPVEKIKMIATLVNIVSQWVIPVLIIAVIAFALYRKVSIFDVFVEGAKEGFGMAIRLIPFLVGMLVAIGLLRDSGAMELLINALSPLLVKYNLCLLYTSRCV